MVVCIQKHSKNSYNDSNKQNAAIAHPEQIRPQDREPAPVDGVMPAVFAAPSLELPVATDPPMPL
jgi:hypothetical protein